MYKQMNITAQQAQSTKLFKNLKQEWDIIKITKIITAYNNEHCYSTTSKWIKIFEDLK